MSSVWWPAFDPSAAMDSLHRAIHGMGSSGVTKQMSTRQSHLYLGIDVQASRGCPYVVLDQSGEPVDAGWLSGGLGEVVRGLGKVVDRHSGTRGSSLAAGIDAPRVPLRSPRQWYWDGNTARWRPARPSDRGNGRHCEIVIAAHRIANPQWTPHRPPFPEWMQLGFALFTSLVKCVPTYEVFPSASYALMDGDPPIRIGVWLKGFARGPKDILDAYVAAATVREFVQERGSAMGGGDGLGQIILPRPLPKPIEEVLRWPTA